MIPPTARFDKLLQPAIAKILCCSYRLGLPASVKLKLKKLSEVKGSYLKVSENQANLRPPEGGRRSPAVWPAISNQTSACHFSREIDGTGRGNSCKELFGREGRGHEFHHASPGFFPPDPEPAMAADYYNLLKIQYFL
jgi:hypothetical protein